MKKGFTLVEISIVLIILGFLAGGILIGRSIIRTAQINSFIKQIQQYDIVVSNFKTKYGENCIPADCNFFGGDGNGLITDATPNDDDFTGEMANFWNELSTQGWLNDGKTYSTNASAGIRAGINLPKAKIGRDGGIMVACEWDTKENSFPGYEQNYPDWDDKKYNYYHIFSTAGTTGTNLDAGGTAGSINAADAAAVDAKIDDGNAINGWVRVSGSADSIAYFPAGVPFFPTSVPGGPGCVLVSNNSVWNVNSSAQYPCSMVIPLLSQIGQIK